MGGCRRSGLIGQISKRMAGQMPDLSSGGIHHAASDPTFLTFVYRYTEVEFCRLFFALHLISAKDKVLQRPVELTIKADIHIFNDVAQRRGNSVSAGAPCSA